MAKDSHKYNVISSL